MPGAAVDAGGGRAPYRGGLSPGEALTLGGTKHDISVTGATNKAQWYIQGMSAEQVAATDDKVGAVRDNLTDRADDSAVRRVHFPSRLYGPVWAC